MAAENSADKKTSLDEIMKEKFQSFWLVPENHPSRLAVHIALRGVFASATVSTLIAAPVLLYRKNRPITSGLGRAAFRGGLGGGVVLALIAAERLYHLDPEGVEDRSYRLAYNWDQTKWDLFALDGAILTGLLYRRPFGGILPAMAIGTVLGTFVWGAAEATSKMKMKA